MHYHIPQNTPRPPRAHSKYAACLMVATHHLCCGGNGYLSYGGVQPKYIALLLDLDGTHSVPRARCLVARCTAVSSLPRLRARGSPGRLRGGPGHAKSGKRTDTTSLYPLARPRPTTDTRALPSQCDGHRRCPQRVGVLYRNNRPARSVLVAGAS